MYKSVYMTIVIILLLAIFRMVMFSGLTQDHQKKQTLQPDSNLVYICNDCGYETDSEQEILNHTEETGSGYHCEQR